MSDSRIQDGDYDVCKAVYYDGRQQPVRASLFGTRVVLQRDQAPPGTETRRADPRGETGCGEKVSHGHEALSADAVVRPGGAVLRPASRSDGQNHPTQSDSGGVHVVSSGGLD